MAQLTRHFSEAEFLGATWLQPSKIRMAQMLELLRWKLGNKKITITSAQRSPDENRRVGGAPQSQHVIGVAVDFQVEGCTPEEVAAVLIDGIKAGVIDAGGVGIYRAHVHYDLRGKLVVWRSDSR